MKFNNKLIVTIAITLGAILMMSLGVLLNNYVFNKFYIPDDELLERNKFKIEIYVSYKDEYNYERSDEIYDFENQSLTHFIVDNYEVMCYDSTWTNAESTCDPDSDMFITSINGISQSSNSFISLYINGESSMVGLSDITLEAGMIITFREETYSL